MTQIVFDQFTDGDYTSNPTWTVASGAAAVTGGKLGESGTSGAVLNTPASFTSNSLKLEYYVSPANNLDEYQLAVTNNSSISSGEGYVLFVRPNSGSTGEVILIKKIGGSNTSLLTISGLTINTGNEYQVTATRTGGLWEIELDGTPIGTYADGAYTVFTHAHIAIDGPGAVQGGQVDNVLVESLDYTTFSYSDTFTASDGTNIETYNANWNSASDTTTFEHQIVGNTLRVYTDNDGTGGTSAVTLAGLPTKDPTDSGVIYTFQFTMTENATVVGSGHEGRFGIGQMTHNISGYNPGIAIFFDETGLNSQVYVNNSAVGSTFTLSNGHVIKFILTRTSTDNQYDVEVITNSVSRYSASGVTLTEPIAFKINCGANGVGTGEYSIKIDDYSQTATPFLVDLVETVGVTDTLDLEPGKSFVETVGVTDTLTMTPGQINATETVSVTDTLAMSPGQKALSETVSVTDTLDIHQIWTNSILGRAYVGVEPNIFINGIRYDDYVSHYSWKERLNEVPSMNAELFGLTATEKLDIAQNKSVSIKSGDKLLFPVNIITEPNYSSDEQGSIEGFGRVSRILKDYKTVKTASADADSTENQPQWTNIQLSTIVQEQIDSGTGLTLGINDITELVSTRSDNDNDLSFLVGTIVDIAGEEWWESGDSGNTFNASNQRGAKTISSFTEFTNDGNTLFLYHFSEGSGSSVNDSGSNNRDLTWAGTPQWSATSVAGTYSVGSFSTANYLESGAFTSTAASGTMEFITYLNALPTGSDRFHFVTQLNTGETANYLEMYVRSDGKVYGQVNTQTGTPLLISSNYLTAGRWYHIKMTWNGTSHKLYINNGLEDSETSSAGIDTGSRKWRYGRTFSGSGTLGLDGLIDEVRLSNSVRSLTTGIEYTYPSVYTFNISGANQNCTQTENITDWDNLFNSITGLGYGDGINQLKSYIDYATTNRTFITTSCDENDTTITVEDTSLFKTPATTTLNGALGSGDTTITVVSTTGFAERGTIKIGAEQINYTGTTATTFTGCTRGANGTTAGSVSNLSFSDNFTDGDYTANPTWTVQAGSFTVSSNKLSCTTDNSRINSSFTSINSTELEFGARVSFSSASNGNTHIEINNSTGSNSDGYRLIVDNTNNQIGLDKTLASGGNTILISTSQSYSAGVEYLVEARRTSAGVWQIYVDGAPVGGTASNTDFTQFSVFQYKVFLSATTITADDIFADFTATSAVSELPNIWIAMELCNYSGKTATTFTGVTRSLTGSNPGPFQTGGTTYYITTGTNGYPHSVGIPVWDAQYTIDDPQTGSSIEVNDLKENPSVKDLTIIDQNALDFAIAAYGEEHKDLLTRIKLTPVDYLVVLRAIEIGDTVTINDSDAELSDDYRLVGKTLTYDYGNYTLELEFGNFPLKFIDEVKSAKDESTNLSKYMQGSVNIDSVSFVDNLENEASPTSNPAPGALDLFFDIPVDAVAINKVLLSYRLTAPKTWNNVSASSDTGEYFNQLITSFDDGFTSDTSSTAEFINVGVVAPATGTYNGVLVTAQIFNKSGSNDTYDFTIQNTDTATTLTTVTNESINDNSGKVFNYKYTSGQVSSGHTLKFNITSGVVGTQAGKGRQGYIAITVQTLSSHTHNTGYDLATQSYTATDMRVFITNDASGSPTWTEITSALEAIYGTLANSNNSSETDLDITSYFKDTGWKGVRLVTNGNARASANVSSKFYVQSKL